MPNHFFCTHKVQAQYNYPFRYFKISPSSYIFPSFAHTKEFPDKIFRLRSSNLAAKSLLENCRCTVLQGSEAMKNRAPVLLKQIIATLKSMAKSKALALKTKTSAIKARLIIFSLLRNKKFLMSSISQKFQSVLGHHSRPKDDSCLEDGSDRSKAMEIHNENALCYQAVPSPMETNLVEEGGEDGYESCYGYEEEEEYEKYPDLTHTLFESEDFGGSVIDMVKNSKEEAGEEFKLENEIDYVADLFIKRIRKQMILQKQQSIKRKQEEMLKNSGE